MKREFRRRRSAQRKVQALALAAFLAAFLVSRWIGMGDGYLIFGITVLATGLLAWTMHNWRCPSCSRYLGSRIVIHRCPWCDAELR